MLLHFQRRALDLTALSSLRCGESVTCISPELWPTTMQGKASVLSEQFYKLSSHRSERAGCRETYIRRFNISWKL